MGNNFYSHINIHRESRIFGMYCNRKRVHCMCTLYELLISALTITPLYLLLLITFFNSNQVVQISNQS